MIVQRLEDFIKSRKLYERLGAPWKTRASAKTRKSSKKRLLFIESVAGRVDVNSPRWMLAIMRGILFAQHNLSPK
jgi:hypothetical protein